MQVAVGQRPGSSTEEPNERRAIRFQASAFLLGKLTLYPGVSLVENIGQDGTGEHRDDNAQHFKVHLGLSLPDLDELPVTENQEVRQAYENFFRGLRGSLVRRAFTKISRALVSLLPA